MSMKRNVPKIGEELWRGEATSRSSAIHQVGRKYGVMAVWAEGSLFSIRDLEGSFELRYISGSGEGTKWKAIRIE